MMSILDGDWQAGRNRFNHDWLKNKFSLSLDRLVKIAEDKIEDEAYASRFVAGGMLDWKRENKSASELIESFESAMSPRKFLDQPPLCRSQHREWLRSVVHALWRSRADVDGLLDLARRKLKEADIAYEKLCQCVAQNCGKPDCARLACCRTELIEFRDKCRELATAFERFPHRILVT
jgi:hypothetical protein